MSSGSVVDLDEFDVVTTRAVGFAKDLSPHLEDVEIVYKRVQRQWIPWVMVAESSALRGLGLRQRGLYALHDFRGPRKTRLATVPGQKIGRYGGAVLGTFDNPNAPAARTQMDDWAREGRSSMLLYRINPREGWSVIDGFRSGPPFLWRINDVRGTKQTANVLFGETGFAVAHSNIPAAALDAPSLHAIANSELLVNYEAGRRGHFWRMHDTLGSAANPYVFNNVA